jgi:hypothetical protein
MCNPFLADWEVRQYHRSPSLCFGVLQLLIESAGSND